jgi:nucleotide sugar dehydrogenase
MEHTDAKGKIAVMGIGYVGGALARYLDEAGHAPLRYDPPKGLGNDAVLAMADVIFVCVPTPYLADGVGFDLSFVRAAIAAIPGEKTVVIKSTVLPGTTELLQKEFPQHRMLFNPEFLRQATADEDMKRPDRQLMGYTERSKDIAPFILRLLPNAPFLRTLPATEAETVKYFGNCFLAMKVVFANQMFDVCQAMGIDYDIVKDCTAGDPRIGASHLQVLHDGFRGYGGSCFPKDVKSLIQLGESLGVDMTLLATADRINEDLVKNRQPA